jgi:hypothetical protein
MTHGRMGDRASPKNCAVMCGSRSAGRLGKKLRPLTDTERDMVADAIVEHIRLCNWKIERGPPWEGFAYLGSTKSK